MKKIIAIVLLLLAIVGISSLASWTDGFTAWDLKELNEDNLIVVDNYVDTLEDKRTDGLTVEVDEDGAITVEGENEGTEDIKITVVSNFPLEDGEYTFGTSSKGSDKKAYYMCIMQGNEIVAADYDEEEDRTFKVKNAEGSSNVYQLCIVVCAGEEIDTTFKPVLVEGDKAGSFYVIG